MLKSCPQFRNLDGKTKSWFTQEHNCECVANLYESKLHPMLRFLHEKILIVVDGLKSK